MDSQSAIHVFSKLLAHFDNADSVFQQTPDRTEAMISELVVAMCGLVCLQRQAIESSPEKFPQNTNELLASLLEKLRGFETRMHDYFLLPHVYAPLGDTTIVEARTLIEIQSLVRQQITLSREAEQMLRAFRHQTENREELLERELGNNFFMRRLEE